MVSSHLSADVMSLVDTLPVLAKTLAVAKTAVAPWKGSKFYCRLEQTTSGPLVMFLCGFITLIMKRGECC
ncbi:unnamed protein product [Brassica oleracea]|uniref:Uncharacterized protein n=1 Tax=Brassica oleracea TaxID=3712 RepID=A0A3P6EY45_BRAOL|nr:unnamed protein product [Brassica oleracea]